MSKNLSKYWFISFFLAVSLTVFFVSFLKVLVLKDFTIELPENCDSADNTCLNGDAGLTPNRFLLLKESYFLKICKNIDFDECIKRCETDSACTPETKNG